ncbi:MAG: FAD-binding oxidoreductase [Caldilineaceae bacterium]|nr:FAD-binding oxidoreductase [Caldilineaceae bacterium]MCY4117747.1 FAD-binding oxidoreductase [Caldilineaceae bacterium]
MDFDLIVVGGGIVGAAAAYRAGQLGARTLLCDRRDAGRATDAGAGILAPESSTRDGRLWYDFALDAVGYYSALIEDLAADCVPGEELSQAYGLCAKMIVALNDVEAASLAEIERTVYTRQEERRTPPEESVRRISPNEARNAYYPLLADASAVLLQPAARRVDGRLMTAALERGLRARRVETSEVDASALLLEDGRVRGVRSSCGDEYTSEAVLIAGGAWSTDFGAQLDVEIPVAPQRGQIIHLQLPGQDTGAWSIVMGFSDHYQVPWPGGRVAVGATRETGSGYAPYATVSGVGEVLREALRLAPGLRDAAIDDIRVGLRPYTSDHLPLLGSVPGVNGVFLATGHGPTGLTLGPYSAKLVVEQALGLPPAWDLTPFSVSRFLR